MSAARPAPETEREPDGYVVQKRGDLPDAKWVTDSAGLFNHRYHADTHAGVLAAGGWLVRTLPVYLGAPAPAEATEASDD